MLRDSPWSFVASALSVFLLSGFLANLVFAQEDKFAKCPDPDAARQYVQKCMAENPYNTREACEQRALAKLCGQKPQ